MFDKDSISRIRGSCDECKEGDENQGLKNQTDVFDFFGAIFITYQESCDDCDGGGGKCISNWVTKIATKKSNRRFQFFRPWFLWPNFPHQQFENLKFSKLFDEDTMSQVRGFCDCNEFWSHFLDTSRISCEYAAPCVTHVPIFYFEANHIAAWHAEATLFCVWPASAQVHSRLYNGRVHTQTHTHCRTTHILMQNLYQGPFHV